MERQVEEQAEGSGELERGGRRLSDRQQRATPGGPDVPGELTNGDGGNAYEAQGNETENADGLRVIPGAGRVGMSKLRSHRGNPQTRCPDTMPGHDALKRCRAGQSRAAAASWHCVTGRQLGRQ